MRSVAVAAACAFVGLSLTTTGFALEAPSPESVARETLRDALAPALAVRGATAVITVAPVDARRLLAPCNLMTGFMPAGARLSGRTTVGVRCADGASWQTFVAAEVRVEGPAWQATHALRAGDPIGAGDLTPVSTVLTAPDLEVASQQARVDAAGGRANPGLRGLASIDGRAAAPIGRVILRPVAAGRALTLSDIRDEGRINPGDVVRVVYLGEGFAVSSDGRSVGSADPGANVMIRLASGALVAGTLRADHLVELPR